MDTRPVMNMFRLPVQVHSGCYASSRIMRSEAIPLEVFGQPEVTFNASSTAIKGHKACATGEPFDLNSRHCHVTIPAYDDIER